MAVTPLASAQAFLGTAYADIATNLQADNLERTMVRATRRAEAMTGRRLAPFTTTDDIRLTDSDQDSSGGRFDVGTLSQQIGVAFADSRGYTDSVRHFWVNEAPPVLGDYWTGTVTSIEVRWPDTVQPITIPIDSVQFFPALGYGRFSIGTTIPQGSMASITYTGGYSEVPEDLEEAIIALAAALIIRSLDPMNASTNHDPEQLLNYAKESLIPYTRGR